MFSISQWQNSIKLIIVQFNYNSVIWYYYITWGTLKYARNVKPSNPTKTTISTNHKPGRPSLSPYIKIPVPTNPITPSNEAWQRAHVLAFWQLLLRPLGIG
jgi:hypothetical protein